MIDLMVTKFLVGYIELQNEIRNYKFFIFTRVNSGFFLHPLFSF